MDIKLGSTIVGISAWGFILGIIVMVLNGKIEFDFNTRFFFAFLCVVGFLSAVQNMSKR